MPFFMQKICSECKISKEISEYYKEKIWLYWVRSKCKVCLSKWHKNRYLNEKEKIRFKQKEYSSSDIWRESGRLKRSKKRALIRTTTDNTINIVSTGNLLKEQQYKCNYCKIDITDRNTRHLDHIHPLSKWWVHSIKNVQWLCCKCNLEKFTKLI